MLLKDYYKILELSPGATIADIKKSFRRLALLYHPDRNFGSNVHEAKFKEIKEAYEVLSDAKQRQEYNSRRREQSQTEKKKTYRQPTAQIILNEAVEFRKKITALDPARMNRRALYHHIQHLLAIQNILIVKHTNDPTISAHFIDEILNCSRFLHFPQVQKICDQLTQLAGTDNEIYKKIYQFSRQSRIHTYWDKYKFLAAVIVAFILCILIYLLSSKF
ncbi:J domain-containing protein [Segetibacter koreensis]|uniref:J domain-containing protein n=1 Tax=Segetibacter koreensis TaxID=398037 RepID=UPI0003680CB8|nr:DnaJ domain-containing protein [Segetibacter koreensis]